MSKTLKRMFCALFSLTLVLSGTPISIAQTVDITAPVITHSVADPGNAGDNLMIEAIVTDNVGVESVTLFYRFKGENTFEELAMAKAAEGNDKYTAIVPSKIGVETELEYYIEAVDTGGTNTTRGLSIDPLSRPIILKQSLEAEPEEPADTPALAQTDAAESGTPSVPEPKSRKWWYVAGGVVLVGILASLGGGDNGGSGSDECEASGCNVTFTLGAP